MCSKAILLLLSRKMGFVLLRSVWVIELWQEDSQYASASIFQYRMEGFLKLSSEELYGHFSPYNFFINIVGADCQLYVQEGSFPKVAPKPPSSGWNQKALTGSYSLSRSSGKATAKVASVLPNKNNKIHRELAWDLRFEQIFPWRMGQFGK